MKDGRQTDFDRIHERQEFVQPRHIAGQQQLVTPILPLPDRNGCLNVVLFVNDEASGGVASLDYRQAAARIQLFAPGALVENVHFP
jgi:hypothetical protein